MTTKESVEQLNSLIEHFNNGGNDFNATDIEAIQCLLKENQELKKQVEEYENELEKADSITQSCIFNGKKESEISYRKCLNMLEKHKNQQKEFIEYLENEIKRINPNDLDIGELNLRLDDIKFTQYLIYKEILSKFNL